MSAHKRLHIAEFPSHPVSIKARATAQETKVEPTESRTDDSGLWSIDKGIPVASEVIPGVKRCYPYRDMDVGESFFVPWKPGTPWRFHISNKQPGKKFISRRTVENGIRGCRIWRTV